MYTHTLIHTHIPRHPHTLINRQFSSLQHEEAAKESWEIIQQFNQADDLRLTPPYHLTLLPSPLNSYPPPSMPFPSWRPRPQNTDWHSRVSGNALSRRPSGNARAAGKQNVENVSTMWRGEENEGGRRVKKGEEWRRNTERAEWRAESGERRAKSQQGRRQVENFLFTCCAVFHAQWLQCD